MHNTVSTADHQGVDPLAAANLSVELRVPASQPDSTDSPGGPSRHEGDRGMLPHTGAAMTLLLVLALLLATAAMLARSLARSVTHSVAPTART